MSSLSRSPESGPQSKRVCSTADAGRPQLEEGADPSRRDIRVDAAGQMPEQHLALVDAQKRDILELVGGRVRRAQARRDDVKALTTCKRYELAAPHDGGGVGRKACLEEAPKP
jgi:hypothetical protein